MCCLDDSAILTKFLVLFGNLLVTCDDWNILPGINGQFPPSFHCERWSMTDLRSKPNPPKTWKLAVPGYYPNPIDRHISPSWTCSHTTAHRRRKLLCRHAWFSTELGSGARCGRCLGLCTECQLMFVSSHGLIFKWMFCIEFIKCLKLLSFYRLFYISFKRRWCFA